MQPVSASSGQDSRIAAERAAVEQAALGPDKRRWGRISGAGAGQAALEKSSQHRLFTPVRSNTPLSAAVEQAALGPDKRRWGWTSGARAGQAALGKSSQHRLFTPVRSNAPLSAAVEQAALGLDKRR